MQQDPTPASKHLILIGGGHAHAIALLMMAMNKVSRKSNLVEFAPFKLSRRSLVEARV